MGDEQRSEMVRIPSIEFLFQGKDIWFTSIYFPLPGQCAREAKYDNWCNSDESGVESVFCSPFQRRKQFGRRFWSLSCTAMNGSISLAREIPDCFQRMAREWRNVFCSVESNRIATVRFLTLKKFVRSSPFPIAHRWTDWRKNNATGELVGSLLWTSRRAQLVRGIFPL